MDFAIYALPPSSPFQLWTGNGYVFEERTWIQSLRTECRGPNHKRTPARNEVAKADQILQTTSINGTAEEKSTTTTAHSKPDGTHDRTPGGPCPLIQCKCHDKTPVQPARLRDQKVSWRYRLLTVLRLDAAVEYP